MRVTVKYLPDASSSEQLAKYETARQTTKFLSLLPAWAKSRRSQKVKPVGHGLYLCHNGPYHGERLDLSTGSDYHGTTGWFTVHGQTGRYVGGCWERAK